MKKVPQTENSARISGEPPSSSPSPASFAADEGEKPADAKEKDDFFKFLIKLVVIVLILRTFIFSPFSIPSESMQPRLLIGDYLIVNKMAYGYSRHSMPFSAPIVPGRIFSSLPERGDVVVFKAPPSDTDDWIKRVIGLPGDRIQMTGGVLSINGEQVPKTRIADAVIPVTANMEAAAQVTGLISPCVDVEREELRGGEKFCRYPQFRETLPNGKSYAVLDIWPDTQGDNTRVFVVPEGHVFLMGDNRDRSADSRFPAVQDRGIAMVPVVNLIGKASFGVFSTDGTASWVNPISWFTAARWDRVGEGF